MNLPARYRPQSFDEVIGHKAVIRSLRTVIANGTASAFLFTGPSGVGKTTLARITARELGCSERNIVEVDAATHTGVDAMRRLIAESHYAPLGSRSRAVILDEAHRLSPAAWDSLLRTLEEPPPRTYWLLCTTEPAAVPATIETRCLPYRLEPFSADVIRYLIGTVCEAEQFTTPDDVLDSVAERANGSPRQALTFLGTCAAAKSSKEALALIGAAARDIGSPDFDASHPIVAMTVEELLAASFPKRAKLLGPWLPEAGLAMLYGMRGVGKTYLAHGIAYAVASGSDFLGWTCDNPGDVVIVDGEMVTADLQERINAFTRHSDRSTEGRLRTATLEMNGGLLPDLATPNGQQKVDVLLTPATKLLILDNLSSLVRSGEENSADSWSAVQQWLVKLRARGHSVLLVHHANKAGQQRGSSRKEDVLDTVICLEQPARYSAERGLDAVLLFTKARSFFGRDAQPFRVRMQQDEHGSMQWIREEPEDTTFDRVVQMVNGGKGQAAIARELDISRQAVHQHVVKARAQGLLGEDEDEQDEPE